MKGRFEELRWAVQSNPEHDLGTDMWVQPRNRRFDLGLMLGVQVKNGTATYFSRPGSVDGRPGWWLNESRDHLDYWLAHSVPHVVVIRDDNGAMYWAHITRESVTWTGKNGKVHIPADHILDETTLPALTAVAATVRPKPRWAGSAWTGAPDLAVTDRFRHALIAPRLVAPHPNAAKRSLDPHEATALLASGRFAELQRYDLADGTTDTGWGWSLFAAVQEFVVCDRVDALETCCDTALHPHEKATATAAFAAGLVEFGRVDDALAVLEAALLHDDYGPVDYVWLQLHRARCLAEIGKTDEAIAQAVDLQGLPALFPDDVTAGAIAAAGAGLVFRASNLFEGDIAATISAADTETSWWLSQSLSWALSAQADELFRRWMDNPGEIRIGADDGAGQLRGVNLVAGFTGLHDRWRSTTSLLAKAAFVGNALDSEEVEDHLTALRRAGDSKAIIGSVRRLLRDGPADAVTAACDRVTLDSLTRTDVQSSVELLIEGADVLSTDQADRLGEWALCPSGQKGEWLERTRPRFALPQRSIRLLRAVLPAASPALTLTTMQHVVSLPPMDDQADAHEWAGILDHLPHQSWALENVQRLLERADDNWELAEAIRRIGFSRVPETRGSVLAELSAGSMASLSFIGPITDVPQEAVAPLVAASGAAMRKRASEVNRGMISFGSPTEPCRVLALLNVNHPDEADWKPITELFESVNSVGSDLIEVLEVLQNFTERLDEVTRQMLIPLIEPVTERPPRRELFGGIDPRAAAAATLSALKPDQVDIMSMMMAGADWRSRRYLVYSLGRRRDPQDMMTLALLATDDDASVRAAVAAVLADWTVREVHPAALEVVTQMLAMDAGTRTARAVAGVTRVATPGAGRTALAELIAHHLSAEARNAANAAMA